MAEEKAAARAARVVLAKVEQEHAGSRMSPLGRSGAERGGKQAGRCSALGPAALADLQYCADSLGAEPASCSSLLPYQIPVMLTT
jgi:hypothetical protein